MYLLSKSDVCCIVSLQIGSETAVCHTVLVLSKLKKITATASQPHRTVFKYFAIFKNVAHSLKPGETPSNSASHLAPNYVQRS